MDAASDGRHGHLKVSWDEDGPCQEDICKCGDVDCVGAVAVEPDDEGNGELELISSDKSTTTLGRV